MWIKVDTRAPNKTQRKGDGNGIGAWTRYAHAGTRRVHKWSHLHVLLLMHATGGACACRPRPAGRVANLAKTSVRSSESTLLVPPSIRLLTFSAMIKKQQTMSICI